MVIAEKSDLAPVIKLISISAFKLELFENDRGELYLSCNSRQPEGTVYFGTTPGLLSSFLDGDIILQRLFDYSPTIFVEIINKDKATIYSSNDIEVTLTYGDHSAKQLGYTGIIETWEAADHEKNQK